MAFKIVWTNQARDDLRDIVAYIAADNRSLAESFGYRLMAKTDLLAEFPHLGRVVPEAHQENTRQIIFPPYRIIYCVLTGRKLIAIVRIWHGARGEPEIPLRWDF